MYLVIKAIHLNAVRYYLITLPFAIKARYSNFKRLNYTSINVLLLVFPLYQLIFNPINRAFVVVNP